MRCWSTVIGLVVAIATMLPAAAQQASSPWLSLPRPADSGKAMIYDQEFVAKGDHDRFFGCTPGLQCRLQLYGVIQNNGFVELRAKALSW